MPKRPAPKPPKSKAPAGAQPGAEAALYDAILGRATTRNLSASAKARDIAPCPAVVDRPRREKAFASLKTFLETYFPNSFPLPWSADHLSVIERLQAVVDGGGQY